MRNLDGIELAIFLVQMCALLVLVWYAIETRRLRTVTEVQTRQATLPVLKIKEVGAAAMTYRVSNIGAGLAVAVEFPQLHLRDAEGNRLTCEFEALHMLAPGGEGDDLEVYVEVRPAGRKAARDLSAGRFEEIIMAIMEPTPSGFTVPVYVTDVAGRNYSVPLTWSYNRAEWEAGAFPSPFPEMGPPELLSPAKTKERVREVTIELRSLAGFL